MSIGAIELAGLTSSAFRLKMSEETALVRRFRTVSSSTNSASRMLKSGETACISMLNSLI